MARACFLIVCVLMFTAFSAGIVLGQHSRKSVSGAEVTGIFRHSFTGKFRGNSSDIKIRALGNGKIRVGFELTYPYTAGKEHMANLGTGGGEAKIDGDIAVFETSEFGGRCRITIKFVRPGLISVTQSENEGQCGFGFNVSASGTYRKISGKKPNFDEQ